MLIQQKEKFQRLSQKFKVKYLTYQVQGKISNLSAELLEISDGPKEVALLIAGHIAKI